MTGSLYVVFVAWVPTCLTGIDILRNLVAEMLKKNINQRTNGPVNAHLSLLHIPINMFEYCGI